MLINAFTIKLNESTNNIEPTKPWSISQALSLLAAALYLPLATMRPLCSSRTAASGRHSLFPLRAVCSGRRTLCPSAGCSLALVESPTAVSAATARARSPSERNKGEERIGRTERKTRLVQKEKVRGPVWPFWNLRDKSEPEEKLWEPNWLFSLFYTTLVLIKLFF